MEHDAGGHRKHLKRYNTPCQAHFLTFSCYRRRPFFSGDLAPQWFLESLDAARKAEGFSLWAFVIMPEHIHLLIAPGAIYDIGRILWKIKRPLTHRILRHVQKTAPEFLEQMTYHHPDGRVTHRFWQAGGGYDRNLWKAKAIREKIRYIHMNPVRRGLVEKPEDWPWTSFRAFAGGPPEPIDLDLEHIPMVVE